ncbi:MAG: undecaprenyl-diphosphate phosphatase [Bacteroidota bacterium]
MTILQAIILAVIEGLTEFLPVSSTGHMIIASALMGIEANSFVKTYEVCIQLGAILAVVVLYFKRFFTSLDFYFRLFVAFLPTAVLGLLLSDYIDALLERPEVVGTTLLLGGILLLFIDRIFKNAYEGSGQVPYKQAFIIGLFQSIAMIPGVSRSAATIIGGQTQGLSRKAAAEFSFFLAVPTMFAATAHKLLKTYKDIQADDISILLIGNVVAFIVGALAIRFFISMLTKYGFRLFGWYRIALGLLIITLSIMGIKLQIF